MADKLGRDAALLRPTPEGLSEPVIEDKHKRDMAIDLYRAGWSFRLIAQAFHMEAEDVRAIICDPGA